MTAVADINEAHVRNLVQIFAARDMEWARDNFRRLATLQHPERLERMQQEPWNLYETQAIELAAASRQFIDQAVRPRLDEATEQGEIPYLTAATVIKVQDLIALRQKLRSIRTPHLPIAACYILVNTYELIQSVTEPSSYTIAARSVATPGQPTWKALDEAARMGEKAARNVYKAVELTGMVGICLLLLAAFVPMFLLSFAWTAVTLLPAVAASQTARIMKPERTTTVRKMCLAFPYWPMWLTTKLWNSLG